MSDVRPPIAVGACGACDVTHPNGWSWTEAAGRHRHVEPTAEQRSSRRTYLEATRGGTTITLEVRHREAIKLIEQFGGIDGDHHKTWVIDQVVRALVGSDAAYAEWVRAVEGDPEDEDNYYGPWDEGIAP